MKNLLPSGFVLFPNRIYLCTHGNKVSSIPLPCLQMRYGHREFVGIEFEVKLDTN